MLPVNIKNIDKGTTDPGVDNWHCQFDMVYTVDMVYTGDIVHTVDTVDTADTVDTVDTVDTTGIKEYFQIDSHTWVSRSIF